MTWAADSLLKVTPAETLVFAWRGVPLLRQGVIPPATTANPPSGGGGGGGGEKVEPVIGAGPIATRAASEGYPVYLPALQQLPGRVEFTAAAKNLIPANTQALVVAAVGEHGFLLLGSGQARAFTQADLRSAFLMAQPLASAMDLADAAAALQ